MSFFTNIYNYREFLKTSVKKDFRGKYKKSFLGVLWSFLNPLFQLLIYSVVFPHIMGNRIENYVVYLIIGLMPWTFFNNTITQSAACIVTNEGIIKKVYFPREILPLSTLTSNLLNFLITESIVFLALLISGIGIGKSIIMLPLIVIIQYIFQLGLSFIFSAITVYIRDVEYIISIFMMLMFYLCPIVYEPEMLPENLVGIFKINPLFHIISFYRQILYKQTFPNIKELFIILLASILILIVGFKVFRKLEKRFAEEL